MKKILITGSNGGIGKSLCQKYYENNYYVIGIDITEKSHIFYSEYHICNLESEKEIINLSNNIENLDILINNAAIQINKSFWEMTTNEWDKTMNINLKSIFLLSKYFFEHLKKSQGNIINIGSVHSIATSDKITAYSCSKHAIVGLTKNMAIELAPYNICVNCISPGAVETDMLKASLLRDNFSNEDKWENFKNKHLLKKITQPNELSDIIYFISTQKIMTGSNIIVDGGVSIKLSTE